MSVAFRRDGDEEHLEPRFEIPLPPGPNLVTARGLAAIRAKVVELETHLAALRDEADRAAPLRDLRYWRTRQATAQPMPQPTGEKVEFGCRVTYRLNGRDRTIHIVGDDEAAPAAGAVAFSAPLSRAMMNAEPGDRVDFGGRTDAIEIRAIAIPEDEPQG